ncbi:hypothetical protein LCL95_08345 [Bacillus timonensis]|nr:hypothetical protein [Bacillus timonensis]
MIKQLLLAVFSLLLIAGCSVDSLAPGGEKPDDAGSKDDALKAIEMSLIVGQDEEEVTFNMNVKNTSKQDVVLTFPSGQRFEIIVTDKNNNEVYKYSKDKAFTEAIEHVKLESGKDLSWSEAWDYTLDGNRLDEGEYQVVANLTASHVNDEEIAKEALKATTTLRIPKMNTAFRNVQVSGEDGVYTVTGEARVFEGSFFYAVEDGHDYVIAETVVNGLEGAPSWAPFKISINISMDKLPENGTLTLNLFERSAKDGSIVNLYNKVLQQFKK